MRKLILVLACSLVTANAFAFSDVQTVTAVKSLVSSLSQEHDLNARAQQVHAFQDFLFQRLNTIEVPSDDDGHIKDQATLERDRQLNEEFRSLNEFDVYVNELPTRLNVQYCAKAQTRLVSTANGVSSPEAKVALQILTAMCAQ